MGKIRFYVLSKNGAMLHPELINLLVEQVQKQGELENLGFGSAYNMPVYLLGEIAEHVESAFVVAWDTDSDMLHPRALVGETEIRGKLLLR